MIVRIRPETPVEAVDGTSPLSVRDRRNIVVNVPTSAKTSNDLSFEFADIAAPQTSQRDMYQLSGECFFLLVRRFFQRCCSVKTQAASLVDRFLNGFNTAVLAYGPTGSGKTFTLMGRFVGLSNFRVVSDLSAERSIELKKRL